MTTTDDFDFANATEEQFVRREAQRQIGKVAATLRDLADRIERTGRELERDNRPSAAIVADVANDYMQMTGSAGPTFWGLIRELDRATRA